MSTATPVRPEEHILRARARLEAERARWIRDYRCAIARAAVGQPAPKLHQAARMAEISIDQVEADLIAFQNHGSWTRKIAEWDEAEFDAETARVESDLRETEAALAEVTERHKRLLGERQTLYFRGQDHRDYVHRLRTLETMHPNVWDSVPEPPPPPAPARKPAPAPPTIERLDDEPAPDDGAAINRAPDNGD